MSIGNHIEAPLAIVWTFVASVCGFSVLAWQGVVGVITNEQQIPNSVLFTAIAVLFGTIITMGAWFGTKYLESSRIQSESNSKMADALNKFSDRFDGPLMEIVSAHLSHSYQAGNHHTQTLGASPSQPQQRKRPQ